MRTEKSWAWVPVPLLKVTLDSTPHGGTSLYFAFPGHQIKVERNDVQDHFELWMFWIYSSNKVLNNHNSSHTYDPIFITGNLKLQKRNIN